MPTVKIEGKDYPGGDISVSAEREVILRLAARIANDLAIEVPGVEGSAFDVVPEEWSIEVRRGMPPALLPRLREIGAQALVEAMMQQPHHIVGLIVGAARQGGILA